MNELEFQKVVNIAKLAGKKILEIYNSNDFDISYKDDSSPLTKADSESNKIISESLHELFPNIPILSEEGKNIEFDVRKSWEMFWLVDPLDGTKEFIKRNGEFTVNIALIKNNLPYAGVIYAPVLDTVYYAFPGIGARKSVSGSEPVEISVNKNTSNEIIAVKSRSHSGEEEDKVLKEFNVTNSVSVGSSLKICFVAESKAQIYFRHGPTWEWDTAAGHAILLHAGGINDESYKLSYNKENLLNSSFLFRSF